MRYRVAAGVAHETIDGEVVAIHFISGAYFSFRGPAATVWEALRDGGATAVEMLGGLRTRYPDCPAGAEADVERLVGELLREQLIAGTPDGAAAAPASGSAPAAAEPTGPGAAPAWEPLRFEKYADLEDLLALDPIHDAGDEGWPPPPPAPAGNA